MKIIRGVKQLLKSLSFPIIALGNFDGVHLGHQAIIRKTVERVRREGGTSVVYTFDPHPLRVLNPAKLDGILTTFDEKMNIFQSLGVDCTVCETFTLDFSRHDATYFIKHFLHDGLGAKEIYVGRDFAFGHGRKGSAEDLKRIGLSLGIKVAIEASVLKNGEVVSSSRIRSLIRDGRVAQASKLLGRSYSLGGMVELGVQRGRGLGFATANLFPGEETVPKRGVYAVKVQWSQRDYEGIAHIGSQPTFGDHTERIEVHLFYFDENLYRDSIRVAFVDRIRDERKFEGPEDLVKQIRLDICRAQEILKVGEQEVLEKK